MQWLIILSILKQKLIYLGFSKNASMEMLIQFEENPNQEMNGVITVKHLNPS
jgi:argininosuccinate synthase